MITPVLISTAISGFTNQLMNIHAVAYIAFELQIPFETIGFLDIGCPGIKDSWPACKTNSIIQLERIIDLSVFNSSPLMKTKNISWTEAKNNACWLKNIYGKFNAKFDGNEFEIIGRTLIETNWARHSTKNTEFNWIKFVSIIRESLNAEIKKSGEMILSKLSNFRCIHPRLDFDGYFEPQLSMDDNLRQNIKKYIVTRMPLKKNTFNSFTKFDFGNFPYTIRELLIDAFVCSSKQAITFAGVGRSTFSMLIVAMRTGFGLDSTLHKATFADQPWFNEFYGSLLVKYKTK